MRELLVFHHIDNAEEPNNNMLLNQLQIVRRIRLYNTLEIEELEKLCKSDKELAVRCGANILLGNDVEAQECFDRMSLEEQAFLLSILFVIWETLPILQGNSEEKQWTFDIKRP